MKLTALAMLGILHAGADESDHKVVLSLKGVKGACCVEPVQKAMTGLSGVASAMLAADMADGRYHLTLLLKPGETVTLSRVRKALQAAKPEIDVHGAMTVEYVYYFLAKDPVEKSTAVKALQSLPGYQGVQVHESLVAPLFEGEKIPTLDEVMKAMDLRDAVFAPAKDGFRYGCRTHLEQASGAPGKCPLGPEEFVKMPASRIAKKKTEKTGG